MQINASSLLGDKELYYRACPGTAARSKETGVKLAIISALGVILAGPCVAQTIPGQIDKAHQQLMETLNQADAVTVARMWTDRGIVLPPNSEIIEGREAIEKYWKSVFAAGFRNVSARSLQVDQYGGDAVREIGLTNPPR